MKGRKFLITSLSYIACMLFACVGCKLGVEYTYVDGDVFSTTYHVVYKDKRQENYKVEIDSILRLIDKSLSVYDSSSVTSLINSNKSYNTDVSFRKAFTLCKMVSDSSDGAFDCTVAPLIKAWGFGAKRRSRLFDKEIDSLRQLVNYKSIKLVNDVVVKLNPAITIDMSSVGDGLAVDEVVAFLEKKGIHNYMVEVGGEVKAKGKSPNDAKWKIGIDKPIDDPEALDRAIQQVVLVDGLSVSTSGSYRKYFIRNGQKFSHFIDPQTGKPVIHNLLSATVVDSNCGKADGFSTAFMVMGLSKSLHYLQKDKSMSAYFICSIGDSLVVVTSNNFERYYQK